MLKKCLISAFFFLLLAAVGWTDSTPNMQAGNWEVTVKTKIPGMPMEMPPVTHTQCMDKSDFVPKGTQQQSSQDCQVVDTKVTGNTVTWNIKCGSRGQEMTGSGRVTYNKTTFNGSLKINSKGMQMTCTMKGRRIGGCKASKEGAQ